MSDKAKNKITRLPPVALWGAGYAVVMVFCATISYYWCVFYSFDALPKITIALLCCGFGTLVYGAAYLISHFVKSINLKAALAVFLCGLCFVFASPPFQVPDEVMHYQRAYSVSQGNFGFNGANQYPNDVNTLCANFGLAWTNAHDGAPIKGDINIGNAFEKYYSDLENGVISKVQTEPIVYTVLPYIPQAIFMFIARLLGFTALGILYAARIGNLALFAVLCYFAFKNCKRYKPIFIAMALLPLALFISASCNYDALVFGLALFAASYYCKDEITDKAIVLFCIAVAIMSAIKINNILFIALPLVLPSKIWTGKIKKKHFIFASLGSVVLAAGIFQLYAALFTTNYDPSSIARQEGNAPLEQLIFVLTNPLRFIAVTIGTIYENNLFVFNLGIFGNMDLNLPVVSGLSICALLICGALSAQEKSSLSAKSSVGLFGLSLVYIAGVLAGLYLTYNPLYHIRISGVQPRYFLPALLMMLILLAGVLGHVLQPQKKVQSHDSSIALALCSAVAVVSAVLIMQHYYIGPDLTLFKL